MEKKWIELLSPVGEHKAGAFLEVDEKIARSYIDAGLAKDGGDGPDVVLLNRSIESFRTELKTFVDTTAKAIGDAAESVKKRPIVRGNGVEFSRLENGESEADKSKSIGDFTRSVYLACSSAIMGDVDTARTHHERLTKDYGVVRTGAPTDSLIQRNMTESTGGSLGYTVPVVYESTVLMEAAEEQVFLKNAKNVPLAARQVEYPVINQYAAPTAGQAAWFGGITVYRKGENAQRTITDAKGKKVVLNANDLTAFFELSRDLLQDAQSSPTLDAMIPQLAGGAIGWRSDWECQNGTGVGQLLGIFNSNANINITRNTASHIVYQDIFKMFTRLLPRAQKGAAWYIHPYALGDVLQLQDPGGRFIYLPVIPGTLNGPIGGQVSGTLLGLPVVVTEKMAPLGTAGDIGLFAMDRYLYGTRSGLEIGLSEHFLFDTDQVAIKCKIRNDGKPQLLTPIYLGDGSQSNQVSAFVTLQ